MAIENNIEASLTGFKGRFNKAGANASNFDWQDLGLKEWA